MHTLTVGRTGSGKTTLWKLNAAALIARGCPVLVCDPIGSGIPAHKTFGTAAELMEAARKTNHAHLIIDESGSAVGRSPGELEWLTTKARNWGHSTHLLCQRAQQLDKTVRLQCEMVYLFRATIDDAKLLAGEFTQPELSAAADLDRYQFIKAGPFHPPERFKLTPTRIIKAKR